MTDHINIIRSKEKYYQFRHLYSKAAKSVAERFFILCIFCIRLVVLLGSLVFLLALACVPAIYLWEFLDFLSVSELGKVLFALLWTFLWVISLLLLNLLIHPPIERITELYNNLNTIINDWLKQEKLRKE